MISLLITVILLLSDGKPASKAFFQCSGITGRQTGDDAGTEVEDPIFIVDSRGAVIIDVPEPRTIYCHAEKNGQEWTGPVRLEKDRDHIYIDLK